MARAAVRPGVRRAGHPARIADDDRPAVAGVASHGPPDEIDGVARVRDRPTRRGQSGRPSRQARTSGIAGDRRAAARRAAPSAARSSPPRGTRPARGRCRRSARARRGSGRPCPTSCWRRTRRRSRASSSVEPEAARRRPGRARRAGRCAASFSIGHQRAIGSNSTVVSGTTVGRRAIRRISASAASSSARVTPRTSTSSEQRSATTFGRVPPAMTPTLTVTPGQRPLRACRSRTIRAASRIALRPFSGSTPAWAARPWTVIRRSRIPLRDDTMSPFARAHSRTSARPCPAASSRMCGVEVGEPISSSGLATNDEALERQPAELADQRLERVQPGQQPRLHVGDARAVGDAVVDPERAGGRGARVEDRVHVPDQEDPRRRPVRPSNVATTVSPSRPAGSGRTLDGRAQAGRGTRPSSGRPRRRRPACSCRSRC